MSQIAPRSDGESGPAREASAANGKRAPYARSAGTRARILAAALEEASDAGIHNTSVAAIAARAGVAVGNLHYHFGSKRELLLALMRLLVADLVERLHGSRAGEDAGFFADERRGLLVYLDYLRENPAYVRLGDEVKLHEPDLYARAVEGWVQSFTTRLETAMARGEIRRMTPQAIRTQAHFLLGARQHLDHLRTRSAPGAPCPDDEAVVDAYLDLIRGGLSPEGR